jgi:peroxiredoxin
MPTGIPWFAPFVLLLISAAGWIAPPVSAAPFGEPLAVGEKAPDFELPVQGRDEYLTLSDLAVDGPVVVVVLRGYPGYQCPICNRQVGSMINRAGALSRALGSQPNRVVLVYPGEEDGLQRHADAFLGARRLPEPLVLVRDPGMEMIQSWNLRWNGRRETAYPAAYVIGSGRRVKWAKVSESHGGRASVEEILRAIRKL